MAYIVIYGNTPATEWRFYDLCKLINGQALAEPPEHLQVSNFASGVCAVKQLKCPAKAGKSLNGVLIAVWEKNNLH